MTVVGAEYLERVVAGELYEVKMVFNERGAFVFPATHQHREMKLEGISYEDDYKGNALAAMVRRDAVDIRFHRDFDDASVARLLSALFALPVLTSFGTPRVTYQGRTIVIS